MKWMVALVALSLVGCGDDSGTDDDTEVDSGTEADLGGGTDMFMPTVDMGRADMGSDVDTCVPSGDDLTETVGCNGEPLGSDVADNEFGGACVGTADDAGSCTNEDAVCSGTEGNPGYCLALCEPDADEYITTGSCPSGSRCFTLDTDLALCFPDCRSDDDCLDGYVCDDEGSCVEGDPVEPDGGVMDVDSGVDGGTEMDMFVDGGIDMGLPVGLPDAGFL